MKIGIIGCGTIGAEVAKAIFTGTLPGYVLCGLHDLKEGQAASLSRQLNGGVPVSSLEPLVGISDILFEATAKAAMPDIVERAIHYRKAIVTMSVGGFVDRPDLIESAQARGVHLYLPSGALGGIDALLAGKEAGLNHVTLTTTKHPRSLHGAPYLANRNMTLDGVDKPTVIFTGTAREAIEGFPANANVAITLSLAGIGMDRTGVQIIADPECKRTKQEVVAEGPFGVIRTVTEGIVAPHNPRTGYLAILSAIAVLRRIASSTRIGT
ncbi:MAG: aspartate dehydrogenase [Deltaproteobacteria bacterium]|nr:aspartate dehydrogenase [Deltaproteobacteria bacterium]